ncbi:NAD-dependent epimerase/dehydratase family protein [Gordonia humi]|uniref:Nucleoside-diphosphate-sugar epimerase n=1 Tax=Gordonia humi TaxID=686429 RepID=A0A840F4D4_9ACTN|nr:NAD-dependent epimerase/dehydratase family protein [Gordonia humi]MBB4137363.1 nucleoside-diphosphate-sugar epimerase [Gordonia humi]
MRVLITGGTGFVGGWIAKTVAAHGHDVRLLARSRAKVDVAIEFLGVDPDVVIGEIGDADAVHRALDGCDAVVHAAADVQLHASRTADLVERNRRGTENVLGQAVELGLDPVVHVSSYSALWSRDEPILRPDLPVAGGDDAYGRSKAAAETYARGLQDLGHAVTIVYPGAVMGPSAHGLFGEAGDAVTTLANTGVVGRTAGLTIVDVRDLAEIFVAVLEPGRGPRRYTAGGHLIVRRDLADALTRVTGRRIRYLPIPNWMMIAAGRIADRVPAVVPADLSQLSEAAIGYLLYPPAPDDSATAHDLGVTFRPAAAALAAVWDERPDASD